jgi:hypothetical protein
VQEHDGRLTPVPLASADPVGELERTRHAATLRAALHAGIRRTVVDAREFSLSTPRRQARLRFTHVW